MKISGIVLVLVLALATAASAEYVQGHFRSDGTYVQGYYRSEANRTVDDNYSTKGNINPYTGKRGTEPNSWERPQTYQPRYYTPRDYTKKRY